jgi:hypothetical protein
MNNTAEELIDESQGKYIAALTIIGRSKTKKRAGAVPGQRYQPVVKFFLSFPCFRIFSKNRNIKSKKSAPIPMALGG